MRRVALILVVLALVPVAAGHAGESEFNSTRELIAQGHPCSELTEEQRAAIGDYYMEQMHPGEMHELMDEHMGGEGSESLRQAHLAMADEYYCEGPGATGTTGWMPMHGGWTGSGAGMLWWVLPLAAAAVLVGYLLGGRAGEKA